MASPAPLTPHCVDSEERKGCREKRVAAHVYDLVEALTRGEPLNTWRFKRDFLAYRLSLSLDDGLAVVGALGPPDQDVPKPQKEEEEGGDTDR